jgi:hypothetical protein
MSERHQHEIRAGIETFGADLQKWPAARAAQVRAELLSEPEVRRAFDLARDFDATLVAERAVLDQQIAASGAMERLRWRLLARAKGDPLAGFRWQRLAAAMLVAGMLGGAVDLLLPERTTEPSEAAVLGPFYGAEVDGG